MHRRTGLHPLLFCLSAAVAVVAVQPLSASSPQLDSVFSDDFTEDSRDDYQVEGEASWRPGELLLAGGASITRTIESNLWTKVAVRFGKVETTSGEQSTELRIWLLLNGETDCYLPIRNASSNGDAGSVAIVQTKERNGESESQVEGEALLVQADLKQLTVECRCGLVKVIANQQTVLTAYLGNDESTVTGLIFEAVSGAQRITGLSVLSLPSQPPLTEQQQQLEEEAEALNRELIEAFRRGKFGEAEAVGERLLDLAERTYGKGHLRYATSLNNLAQVCATMGKFSRAEQLFLQSKDVRQDILGNEHPEYATFLNNLATLYYRMGDYSRAEQLYVQALQILKRSLGELDPNYSGSLNNLALLYKAMGEYAQSESLYQEALAIQKNLFGDDDPMYARFLSNLAGLYTAMDEYAKAEPLFERALEIEGDAIGEQHPAYAKTLGNLAMVCIKLGDFSRAERFLLQSNETNQARLGKANPDVVHGLNNLGLLYAYTKQFDRSEELYQQARDIREAVLGVNHPTYALSLSNLGGLYQSMGQHDRAAPLLLEANRVLSNAAKRVIPDSSESQARSWMLANRPRADLFLASLRRQPTRDSTQAYRAVWETKGLVSRLRVGRSISPDAPAETQMAFTELRDARLKLAKLVTAVPSPEQSEGYRRALAAASQTKELKEKRLAQLNEATSRELAVRDAEVNDLLERLPDGVAVVDFVHNDDWEHVDSTVSFQNAAGKSETRTVRKHEPNSVFDAFVLRKASDGKASTVTWIPLGAAEPIEEAIAAWRTEIVSTTAPNRAAQLPSQGSSAAPDQTLRQLVWNKLEPHLEDIQTVILIPDAALNRLPWAALPGRNEDEYLIHDYALASASSGQQLFGLLTDPPIEANSTLLVVGGIDYDQRPQDSSATPKPSLLAANGRSVARSKTDRNWGKLPATVKEMEAVAELWADRGAVEILTNTQADEQSLARLLPQSQFAHLATHGFFDTRGEIYGKDLREQDIFASSGENSQQQSSVAFRNPLLMTGIVMSGANVPPETDDLGLPVGDDGILTAEEISGLNLHSTELVTLSACETGLGDIDTGQGVYGLTRELHKSGVRSVVASLWKVEDLATQKLMQRFYENLWKNQQSKVDALRNAQLWMLNHPEEFPDSFQQNQRGLGANIATSVDTNKNSAPTKDGRISPLYWAAFQLSGDWR